MQFPLTVMERGAADLLGLMPEKAQVDHSKEIVSPMAGKVYSVGVEVGQKVFEGQEVCVVEAMKMQNSLLTAGTGTVRLSPKQNNNNNCYGCFQVKSDVTRHYTYRVLVVHTVLAAFFPLSSN